MLLPSGTLTFLFTDIEGSSRLWEFYPEAMRTALARHDEIIRQAVEGCDGQIFKTAGDAFYAVFADVRSAVAGAWTAQTELQKEAWDARTSLKVRMALNTGSAELRGSDYYGQPLNRASRLLELAYGEQILLSDTTFALLREGLPQGASLRDLGSHRLRDIEQIRIYQLVHAGLRADFPSLQAQKTTIQNLPQQLTAFVGRETEISEWADLVKKATHRLFTVTGFAGIGKTRVAMQIGERVIEQFSDGVWWFDLEQTRTADEMVRRIAEHLALILQPTPSIKEQIFGALRDKRALLILDNLEQIQNAALIVRDLLSAAQQIKCLVTSRRALEVRGETVLELMPMSRVESARLFVERAAEFRPDFTLTDENRTEVETLCERLEGVPLAMELAASRIVGMTPKQILQRLNERFRLLQSRSPDLSPRQRALRGAIDWSYCLLTDEDKSVFAQVSVFVGGFTLADAEAVCEAFDVFESVIALRQQSFFRLEMDASQEETRFLMLESLREYAAEKLMELQQENAVCHRHAAHFLRFAQERLGQARTAREAEALRELEVNRSNLKAALDWASLSESPELFAELALAVGTALTRQGFLQDAAETLQAGLEQIHPCKADFPSLTARLMLERAGLHFDYGQGEEAGKLIAEAKTLLMESQEIGGLAKAENLLGQVKMQEKAFSKAEEHFIQSLKLFQIAGNTVGIAIVYNNLGVLFHRDAAHGPDRFVKAETHLQEALKLRRRLDDRRGIAETLNNLGVGAFYQQKYRAAWDHYSEALGYEHNLRHVPGIAFALANLGEAVAQLGDTDRAVLLLLSAERLLREIRSPDPVVLEVQRMTETTGASQEERERLREFLKTQSLERVISEALAQTQPAPEEQPH